MTRDATEDSVDLWRQVASAVEYIAAVERPGFTVWDALAEAILTWCECRPAGSESGASGDRLRDALAELERVVAPPGAAGGAQYASVVESAIVEWLDWTATRLNDARRF